MGVMMFRKGFTVLGLVLVLAFGGAVVAKSSTTLSGDGSITKGFMFHR